MREFRDERGRQWRAWEVHPDAIHPQTKAEDYLADCFRDGWLVFETVDGLDKRRLCPPPYAWEQRMDEDLARLVERAEILRPPARRRSYAAGAADLPPSIAPDIAAAMPRDAQGNIDTRYLGVVRSFAYPGGEVWRARVVLPTDNEPPVLRFATDTHCIDLAEWPAEWMDLSDADLAELLRIGKSLADRRRDVTPHRRHDDPRSKPDAF